MKRRSLLQTTTAALGGAIAAGCATVTTIPVVGMAEVFPVRRIYCIGRNYAAHAREMGSDPTREPPFFFQKNPQMRFNTWPPVAQWITRTPA